MPRLGSLVPFVVCGLLLACQGDQNLPSEPGRGVELTAGACKSPEFTSRTEGMYTSSSIERTRLQQCKTALAALDRGKTAQAEATVNAIIVAIYNDYLGEDLQTFAGDASLEESVIEYMAIACSLAGLVPGPPECLVPDAPTDLTDGSWVAAGPLAGGGTGELPNDLFGFRVDGGKGVFVFVSSRPVSTSFLGDCPGNSDNDCQKDVFDVDADGTFTTITVESCEAFETGRLRHLHCPPGEECEFGEESPAPGLISCTIAPTGLGAFINGITKPVQWVIRATPAYAAGLGTKFTSFSPVVVGDMDPRARGVICNFTTQYENTSEGTTCELYEDEEATIRAECAPFDDQGNGVPCSCGSIPDEEDPSASSCQMNPKVPASVVYTVKAYKTSGGGGYTAFSSVTLAPDTPPRGGSNDVFFCLVPPNVAGGPCQP
ncbi:MAG TPA: hypothetical protein VFH11_06910 [Gemmatimonadota bacterium]|nr:hypothetical protein [Gemmatimonadota bacterium]